MRRIGLFIASGLVGMFGSELPTGAPPADPTAGQPVPAGARSLEFHVRDAPTRVIGIDGIDGDEALILRWSSTPATRDLPRLPGAGTVGMSAAKHRALQKQVAPGALMMVTTWAPPRAQGQRVVRSQWARQVRFVDGIEPPMGRSLVRVEAIEGGVSVVRPTRWADI